MAILAATLAGPAHAESGPVYLVTYVEVMPKAVASGVTLLERYRTASRKEAGNQRLDVLHEIARPNRFAILEVWKDEAALNGHDKAASTAQLHDALGEIQIAPPDERVNTGIDGRPMQGRDRAGTIYVVTHVDVFQPFKDDCIALLKTMSIDTSQDGGNIGFEVLQQVSHPNHFTVVEAWTTRKALDAHVTAAHTRAFREKLAPMEGAPYDARFYNELD